MYVGGDAEVAVTRCRVEFGEARGGGIGVRYSVIHVASSPSLPGLYFHSLRSEVALAPTDNEKL